MHKCINNIKTFFKHNSIYINIIVIIFLAPYSKQKQIKSSLHKNVSILSLIKIICSLFFTYCLKVSISIIRFHYMSKASYSHTPPNKTTGSQTFKYHSQQLKKTKESRFKNFQTQTFANIPSQHQVQEQKQYDVLQKDNYSSVELKYQIKTLKKLLQFETNLHKKKIQNLNENVIHLKSQLQNKEQQCQHYEKINKQLVKIILEQCPNTKISEKQSSRFKHFQSSITRKRNNQIFQSPINKKADFKSVRSSKKKKTLNHFNEQWGNYQESKIDQVNELGLSSQKDTKINELYQNNFTSDTTYNKHELKDIFFTSLSSNAGKHQKLLLLSKSIGNWKQTKLNDNQTDKNEAMIRYQKRFEDAKQQLQSIRQQLQLKKRTSAIHMR